MLSPPTLNFLAPLRASAKEILLKEAVMSVEQLNLENMSDEALRDIVRENARINGLTRSELIAEASGKALSSTNDNNINKLDVHPLSAVARASASPAQAQIKAVQSVLPWEWCALALIAIAMFTLFSAMG